MMKNLLALIVFTVFLIPAFSHAAVITNLRDEKLVMSKKTVEGYEPLEIQAGETWRTPGNLTVVYGGNEYYLWYYDEYAVWQDGTFGPQRRLYTAGPISR